MHERGYYDVPVATLGPYQLVEQPAVAGVYWLIDTRKPRTRENRHRVAQEPHFGWTVDGEQPGEWVPGHNGLRRAVELWVEAHP